MALLAAGLNHKTVPLGTLERLAVVPSELPKALARLVGMDGIHEGVILSTCNRIEVYAGVHRFHPTAQQIRRFLSDVSGVSQEEVAGGMYTYFDESAVRHLFRVASGIDSMVVGEPQILGQVRDALGAAEEEGTARRTLSPLFQRALRVGKRARSETAIARHVVSIPAAAARLASELCESLDGRTVVVVGAGRIAELAARSVQELEPSRVVIANRTPDRARDLAQRLGCEWTGLGELPRLLREADALISTTSAPGVVVEAPTMEEATRGRPAPLVAVDVAVPRDISPEARSLRSVVLRDLDDLRARVDEGTRERLRELPKVEAIVDEEVESFGSWQRSQALGPSISALHDWAEEVRTAEVRKAARRMGLDEAGREALDVLTRSVVNKLLHRPVVKIKELAGDPDGQIFLEAFQELFDLDVPGE